MWLIGNLLDVLRLSFPKAAQHWRKQYGPVFKVMLGAVSSCLAIAAERQTSVQQNSTFGNALHMPIW